jgi:hypothetical protein
MGIRNAKPEAYREVLEDYIQHQRTPLIENEARGCFGCRRRKAEMEMQRKQQANMRA